MPLLPVAAFLAGALLSLLLPVALLIALTVWYMAFVRRVPETSERDKPGLPGAGVLPADGGTGIRGDGDRGPSGV